MMLTQVREFALSLPEAVEAPHFERTSFRVRGKIFATALPDGDYLNIFVSDAERAIAVATEPDFLEDLHWGKNVVGLRVLLAAAKPNVVNQLLVQAWSRKAPKKLLASLVATPPSARARNQT